MAHETKFVIPRPTSGDVVDVIIEDHRVFEHLLRDIRDASVDREGARKAFAALMVAHSLAEETEVYPTLRHKTDEVGEHEAEHGEEEHAESLADTLALLEAKGLDTQKYADAAEAVSNSLYHHITEEELTILNPARDELTEATRAELGAKFLAERGRLLDEDCGDIEYVRKEVAKAVRKNRVDADDVPESGKP